MCAAFTLQAQVHVMVCLGLRADGVSNNTLSWCLKPGFNKILVVVTWSYIEAAVLWSRDSMGVSPPILPAL
jgi:hypothetical protein